jgi:cytochrome c551/c552
MHNCGKMRDGGREHCDHYFEGQACCQCGNTREVLPVDPQHRAVAAILAEITQHLEDVVETAKNGDANNWNGYYLPKFAELSKQARQALHDAGERP